MLVLVDGQHAIGDRHPVVERHAHQRIGTAIGDLFVVPRVAAHDATQRDQARVAAGLGQARGGERQFPGARDADHVDRILGDAVGGERGARAGNQAVGDAGIPATGDDRESGAFRGAQVAFEMGHGGLANWGRGREL